MLMASGYQYSCLSIHYCHCCRGYILMISAKVVLMTILWFLDNGATVDGDDYGWDWMLLDMAVGVGADEEDCEFQPHQGFHWRYGTSFFSGPWLQISQARNETKSREEADVDQINVLQEVLNQWSLWCFVCIISFTILKRNHEWLKFSCVSRTRVS